MHGVGCREHVGRLRPSHGTCPRRDQIRARRAVPQQGPGAKVQGLHVGGDPSKLTVELRAEWRKQEAALATLEAEVAMEAGKGGR